MDINAMLSSGGTVDLATLENLVKMMKAQKLAEVRAEELPDMLAKSAVISGSVNAGASEETNKVFDSTTNEAPFSSSSSSSSSTVPVFSVGKSGSPSKKKPASKAASPKLNFSMGKMNLGDNGAAAPIMPPAPPVFSFGSSTTIPTTSPDMTGSVAATTTKFASIPQTSSAENTNYFTFTGKENIRFSPGVQVVSPSASSRATIPTEMPAREPSLVTPRNIPLAVPPPAAATTFANFVFDQHINSASPAGTNATAPATEPSSSEPHDYGEEHEAEWRDEDSDTEYDPSDDGGDDDEEEGLVINKANKAKWAREIAADQASKLKSYQKFVHEDDDLSDPSAEDSDSDYKDNDDSENSDPYRKEDVDDDDDEKEVETPDPRYFQPQNSKVSNIHFVGSSPVAKKATGTGIDVGESVDLPSASDMSPDPGSPMDCSSPVQVPASTTSSRASETANVWKEPSYISSTSVSGIGVGATAAAGIGGVMPPPPPFVFSHGTKSSAKPTSATAAAGPIGLSNYFGEKSSVAAAGTGTTAGSAPFSVGNVNATSTPSISIDLNAGMTPAPAFSLGSTSAPAKKKPIKPVSKAAAVSPASSAAVGKSSPSKYYNARTGKYYEISSDSESDHDDGADQKTRIHVTSMKKSSSSADGDDVDSLSNKVGKMWGGMPVPPPVPTSDTPTVPPPPPANPRTTKPPQFGASLSARMAANATAAKEKPKPVSASQMPPAPPTAPSTFPPPPPVAPAATATATPLSDTGNKMNSSMAMMADSHRKDGKACYEKEQYEKSYISFTKALEVAPSEWFYKATVLGNRAAALMMLDRFVEAADDCQQALKCDPTLVRLHSRRARALCKLGELTEATAAYTRVLEHVSANTMASVKAHANSNTTLSEAARNSAAASAEDSSNKKDAQDGLKQLTVARDLLQFITKEDEKEGAWTNKGSSATSTASLTARELMTKVDDLLAICPQMRRAQSFKAKGLVKQGHYKEAKDYVEGVIRSTPSSVLAQHSHPAATFPVPTKSDLAWSVNVKAAVNKISVKTASLINFFLVIGSSRSSGSLAVWYINAIKNMDICRLHSTEVINILAEVLDSLANTCTSRGISYSRDGSAADEWITTENEKSTTWISLKKQADNLFRGGNYAEAIKLYTELLKVDPEATKFNCVIYSNRAAGYMSLNCYSEAIGDCNKAVALDSEFGRAYLRRARAHKAQKHWAASIRDYRRYLSSDPTPVDGVAVQKEMEETGVERDKQTQSQNQKTTGASASAASSASSGAKSRPSYWDYYSKAGANGDDSEESDKYNKNSKSKSSPKKGASKPGDKYNCYYNPVSGKYESQSSYSGGMKGEQESSSESESDEDSDSDPYSTKPTSDSDPYSTKPTSQTRYDYEAYRSQFYNNASKKANNPPPAPSRTPDSSYAGSNKYNSTKPASGPSAHQQRGTGPGNVAYNPATNSYYYTNDPPKPPKPAAKPSTSGYNYNTKPKSSYSTYSDDDDYGWNQHSKPNANPYGQYYSSKTAGNSNPYSNPYSNRNSSSSSSSGPHYYSSSSSSSGSKPAVGKAKADDHYGMLGVHYKATEVEIKKAYRKLAMQYHPDKNKDPSAQGIFQNINNAYAVLSDPALRRKHDLTRPY